MTIQLSETNYAKILAILEAVEDREGWHKDFVPGHDHNDRVITTLVRFLMAGAAAHGEPHIAVRLASIIADKLDKEELDFVSDCATDWHEIQTIIREHGNGK